MNIKSLIVSLLVAIPSLNFSQNTEFSGSIELGGYISSRDSLPFWMTANQYGRLDHDTRVVGLLTAKVNHTINENSFLTVGGGLLFNDAAAPVLRADSWYAQYQNKWFGVVTGKKQRDIAYGGLSTSGESILWSDNARPLPGVYVYTAKPIALLRSQKLLFSAYWGEYLMDDDRYVENARVHSKGLDIIYKPNLTTEILVGLEHVAQWAGTHPTQGELPSSFKDYLRIVSGSAGGESANVNEQINALGNSIGSYRIKFKKQYENFNMELFWNSVFEDGSGRELNNLPDGRYGVFIQRKKCQALVQNMIYEFYYMKNHSDNAPPSSRGDNYFSNYVYKSGWTYHRNIIGSPFFLPNPNGFGIGNNRFLAHHIGVGGVIKNLPYRILATYRSNHGVKHRVDASIAKGTSVFSGRFDLKIPMPYIELNTVFGVDYSEVQKPEYALGVHLVKKF